MGLAIGRAACPLVGHPKAAPQHGASNSYSAARSLQSRPLVLPTPNGAAPPAITASAMARSDAGAFACPCHGAPEKRHDGLLVMLPLRNSVPLRASLLVWRAIRHPS